VKSQPNIRNPRARAAQGTRAGIVSRLIADGIDFGVLQVIFLSILVGIAVVKFLINRGGFEVTAPNPAVTVVTQWAIFTLYLGSGWSTTGRTIGKTVLGLRVLSLDGTHLPTRHAFLRAVCCATFYPGVLWVAISRKNLALHDILCRSEVVYDWRAADVELDAPIRQDVPEQQTA
jgi:uncharacterized RDD family membrane protein YckC